MAKSYTKEDLVNFRKQHDTLVGIDSDGCVFDTMGAKQKDHFHPLIIEVWGLEPIEPQLRKAAEFFNLYSKWRGQNRFIALLKVFEALPDMPGVADSGVALPPTESLRAYIESGLPLGNPSLSEEVQRTGDPELQRLLGWSLAVNKDIAENMDEIGPFKGVRKCLEKMGATSDLLIVSQTPEEALVHEWDLHGIQHYVQAIAGQELGTKTEHLQMVREGRYEGSQVLMIGDAAGDRKAAAENDALFFPINPGHEEESWQALYEEGYDKFLAGSFSGSYQQKLIDEFEALLPEAYPWLT